MLLKDKQILITGAARGIGRQIAETCAREGAELICICRKEDDNSRSLAQSTGCRIAIADVSDYDQVAAVAKTIDHLDVLVNNAGITNDGLIIRQSPEAWAKVLQTNLTSVYNTIRAFSSTMLRQRSGSIINMSSVVGLVGNAGQSSYAASKAGIIGLTRSITKEFGSRGIRCNAIAPGFINTDMTDALSQEAQDYWKTQIPMGRPGTPEDVAGVVVFLASDLSRYVSGQVICCDGGLVL